ncbi:MAG: hypothetical protein JWN11_1741 [Hyphomicrobiales bacterium]|nr:hypothetical protein [Hyphomicrobiales bacterium]
MSATSVATAPDSVPRCGLVLAKNADGVDLPVIDVTDPRFAVDRSGSAALAKLPAYIAGEKRRALPRWLLRMFIRLAARQSFLLRAMLSSGDGYLAGLATYLLKLGPDNLISPFDSPLDKKVAESLPAEAIRVRLAQCAYLLAEGLETQLAARTDGTLHLLNIGGGPAMDSLNALLILHRTAPALLVGRPVRIHVLDSDQNGPAFGHNALAALMAGGGPLAGYDITLSLVPFDWRDPAPLKTLLAHLAGEPSIVAASSEGALFEYGDDASIVGCLKALHDGAPKGSIVVGSVTRNDEATLLFKASNRDFKIVPRGIAAFTQLAERAGFKLAQSEPAPFSDQVLLKRP